MSSYRDLRVWQTAMDLAVRTYEETSAFPSEERFGITQQMRRAAVSVASNIAEGYGRRTSRQRYNFLETALGSLFELETQTELSARIGLLQEANSHAMLEMIRSTGRGLTSLMRYVQSEARQETKRHLPP
ncbi:MAG TPA: four helix bundle protein [Thermoanaerobaculia bacterium]